MGRARGEVGPEASLVPLERALAATVSTWVHSAAQVMTFAGPSLPWPLTGQDILTAADVERRRAVGLDVDGEAVAFGSFRMVGDAARLGWVLVNPARRGEGWGRMLMERLIATASAEPGVRRICLGVHAGNTAARALYVSLGFEPVGDPRTCELNGAPWVSSEMELALPQRAGEPGGETP